MSVATTSYHQEETQQGNLSDKESPQKISWEEFESDYLNRKDGYKYEWVHGMVEKTDRTMNPTQLYIQGNLIAFFHSLLFKGKVDGKLLAEADLKFLSNVHRRPDAVWLTDEQIYRLVEPKIIEVPLFLIEVISKHDKAEDLEKKMDEYRTAGVRVVWQIFPSSQTVHVYSGADMTEMKVRKGEDICSARPALNDFEMKVSEVFFKKPVASPPQ